MVLSRLTKITGPGINTDTNWVGNNANYTGIVTANSFVGDGSDLVGVASTDNIITGTAATFNTYPVDINAGMTVAGVATFAGNVSIAGTLTYEDVTNIDSVGIITARTGLVSPYADIDDFLDVGSNIKLGNAGVITATSFVGSGANLTGIDATSIKDSGGNVKIQAQASGAVYTGIHTFNSDLDVDGHTNLDNVDVVGVLTVTRSGSNTAAIFSGAGGAGSIQIKDGDDGTLAIISVDGGNLKFKTSGSSYSDKLVINPAGNVSIAKDLDVDGHTNLDNVSIAGVTTFTGDTTFSGATSAISVDGDIRFTNSGWAGNAGAKLQHHNNYLYITTGASGLYIRDEGSNNWWVFDTNGHFKPVTDSAIDIGTSSVRVRNGYFDTLYGSGANLTSLPAQVTLSNNADNRVITGGSGVNLNGEANFTYDGNTITLNNDADQEGILMTGGDIYHTLTFNANRNIQNYSLGDVRGKWNGTEVNRIRFNTGADTTNRDEGWLTFWTKPSGGGIVERLRIGSDGTVNIAGIVTATTVTQRVSKFYGLTTTDRNALTPGEGEIIYNTTTNKHEFYTSSNQWAPVSSTMPEFDNASGSLGTIYGESRGGYTLSNQPTASGDAPITYSISSGSLPTGMSINSSTGAISGTPNAVGSDTTSNFTVQAANLGGAVTRDYSIIVKTSITTNYSYTGSTVTWSKPNANVRNVVFRMWGGAGTHGTCTSNSQHPGAGGKTEGIINVTNHSSLYLQVGEAGKDTSTGSGGWPNGGSGNISHSCKGAGGGGSSNIYHSSGTGSYTYIVAVAGGGGSVSHGNPNSNGGDGGGTNGSSSNRGGGGGSQNAGGSQGSTPCGNTGGNGTGTRLQGGSAGGGSGCTNSGAGGGGGWWGGGAGGNSNSGNTYGGGGGGSGYFDTSLVSSGATKSYGESGWSADQPSGIAARASYGDNNRGGHGYITIVY